MTDLPPADAPASPDGLGRSLDLPAPATGVAPGAGLSPGRIAVLRSLALAFPLGAGLLVFGWRAAALVGIVVAAGIAAAVAWRQVGRRGAAVTLGEAASLATLLGLMLPAHLLSTAGELPAAYPAGPAWPILPAAGIVLVGLCWLLGGTHRVHPVLLAYLLLVVCFRPWLEPAHVLHPERLARGDVLKAVPLAPGSLDEPWVRRPPPPPPADAILREPVATQLLRYTTARQPPDRLWTSMQGLIRDRFPPLEDLIVAGEPRPIGQASAVAVVIGGLFLLYRGLIDYRIPLVMIVSAFLALLVLPVPVSITEQGPQWEWLALRPAAATWGVAVTFANYELLASPLLFAAFFLATSPSIRPMARGWRPAFAAAAGVMTAALQLYVDVSIGPYVGLLLAGLLVPAMDRAWHGSRR